MLTRPKRPAPGEPTPRMRGYGWMKRRLRWLMAHPLCVACLRQGMTTLAEEIDHVIPLHKGGADSESNFQSLCVTCHKAKTAKDMGWVWRPPIGVDGWPL
jgi:5-methylcytosine-specific restriction enzyme A